MEKTFQITIPSEPYGEIDENAVNVNVTYTGPAYLVFSLDANGNFFTIESMVDNASQINLSEFEHPGHTFHILDADANPFEAALITSEYTNETVEPFKQTLPTGEEISYEYPANGILGVFWKRELNYNPISRAWSTPERVREPISNVELLSIIQKKIVDMEAALAGENTFSDDLKTEINNWLTWAKSAATNYAGLPGWKIPHPPTPMY